MRLFDGVGSMQFLDDRTPDMMPWRVALAFGDVGLTLRLIILRSEPPRATRRGLRPPAERMEQISAERFEIGRMIPESVHDAVDAGRLAAGALPFRETPELPLLLGAASQVMARARRSHEIVGRERVPDAQTHPPRKMTVGVRTMRVLFVRRSRVRPSWPPASMGIPC